MRHLLLLCTCLASLAAQAETDGTIRAHFFNVSGTRTLDAEAAGAGLVANGVLTRSGGWHSRADVLFNRAIDGDKPLDLQDREVFAGVAWDGGLFRAGRQIIVAGRADSFNPTDVLTPWDRTLVVMDDSWQRYGRLGSLLRQSWGDVSVSLAAFHDDRYERLPKPPVPGVVFHEDHTGRDAYALRADYAAALIEGGVLVYRGADLQPSFDLAGIAAGDVRETHDRISLWGMDAATTLGSVALRGEVACVRTADATGSNPWIRNDQCQAVVGVDRSFSSTQVLLQVAGISVDDWRAPASPLEALYAATVGQGLARETLLTGRVATTFLNEAVQLELSCAFGLEASDSACRPRVKWTLSDHTAFHFGADAYAGDQAGYLGRLGDNTLVFASLELFGG